MDYFPYVIKFFRGHVYERIVMPDSTRPSTSTSTSSVTVYKSITEVVKQYSVTEPSGDAPTGCEPWEMLEIVRECQHCLLYTSPSPRDRG